MNTKLCGVQIYNSIAVRVLSQLLAQMVFGKLCTMQSFCNRIDHLKSSGDGSELVVVITDMKHAKAYAVP